MKFHSAKAALTSGTFFVQLIITILINFGINFGIAWGTYSNWGSRSDHNEWPACYVFKWNSVAKSNLFLDLSLTGFLLSTMCSLLGSGGAQQEIRKGKCPTLDEDVTKRGFWRFTPVRVPFICLRSIVMGVYFWIIAALPTILILYAVLGPDGTFTGYNYVFFKGFWAAGIAIPVYILVFLAAIDARHFPELEGDEFTPVLDYGTKDQPPLIGRVGRV